MSTTYQEAIDFLAAGSTTSQLISYRPSQEAQRYFEALVAKEKREGLLPDEAEELERMMETERLISLVKAKARIKAAEPQKS